MLVLVSDERSPRISVVISWTRASRRVEVSNCYIGLGPRDNLCTTNTLSVMLMIVTDYQFKARRERQTLSVPYFDHECRLRRAVAKKDDSDRPLPSCYDIDIAEQLLSDDFVRLHGT